MYLSPKWTIVSKRLWPQMWHRRPVAWRLRLVFSVTSNNLRNGRIGLHRLQTSMNMLPWTSESAYLSRKVNFSIKLFKWEARMFGFYLGIPLLRWRPSQFWETMCFSFPFLNRVYKAMWVKVGSAASKLNSSTSWPFSSNVQTPFGPR